MKQTWSGNSGSGNGERLSFSAKIGDYRYVTALDCGKITSLLSTTRVPGRITFLTAGEINVARVFSTEARKRFEASPFRRR